MFNIKQFKDIEVGNIYVNFKKYKSLAIYDTLDADKLQYVLHNMYQLKTQAVEVTFDANNKSMLKDAIGAGFKPTYNWYIYNVTKDDCKLVPGLDICQVKNRRVVKDLLTDQVHELSARMPEMFDANGEEEGWYKSGKKCIVCLKDNKIASVLTYTHEKHNNNIHIYLTYTLPYCRSMGLGSKLIDYVKYIAAKNKIQTITICTDVSNANPVPNMFFKNGFRYFKTGYEKVL